MPTYDYECSKCGHRFEEFQSMKDKPLTKCPKCGGKVKRLIGTGAGFLFKGSGFYITDYRSSSYQEKKKKESGESAGAGKSASEGAGGSGSSGSSGGTTGGGGGSKSGGESKAPGKGSAKSGKSDKKTGG
ncbi:MAG: FmdB family zinc ribbon protein [Candidatus Eiseniibacteriota bacterium]